MCECNFDYNLLNLRSVCQDIPAVVCFSTQFINNCIHLSSQLSAPQMVFFVLLQFDFVQKHLVFYCLNELVVSVLIYLFFIQL